MFVAIIQAKSSEHLIFAHSSLFPSSPKSFSPNSSSSMATTQTTSSSTTKRRAIIRNNGVVAGSVWDTRIQMDEVEGGVKVFTAAKGGPGSKDVDQEGMRVYRRIRRIQSDTAAAKRRTWQQQPQIKVANNDDINDEIVEKEIVVPVKKKEMLPLIVDVPVKKIETPPPVVAVDEEISTSLIDETEEQEVAQNNMQNFDETEIKDQCNVTAAQNRMQSIVDLVMWRDVSKSAFMFGFGSFILCSCSYIKDLNFSLVSAISYLGLVYLAIIFIYKSILRRGSIENEENNDGYVIGEEEAIWLLRFFLPYFNEIMLKIKALFSGDPATTIKLALLLFVLARCGGSITTWTLAKLVFLGVFTIPKILSSYSVQLAKYGKFWLERFSDGWESCTHKKAVAAAIFTVIWNLSSTVARIWSVFMLIVAVKLYQECAVIREEDSSAAAADGDNRSTSLQKRTTGGPTKNAFHVEIKK